MTTALDVTRAEVCGLASKVSTPSTTLPLRLKINPEAVVPRRPPAPSRFRLLKKGDQEGETSAEPLLLRLRRPEPS